MESIRISVHEAKIFAALKSTDQCWLTNQEISARIKDVQLRTIRLHTNKLAIGPRTRPLRSAIKI